jgi:periplasmic protein TonB
MKTELILKSDILDIVFENRNKAYGAYDLRKFYDNRLKKSLGVMVLMVVVFSAFAFIPDKKIAKADIIFETTLAKIPVAEKKEAIKENKEKPAEKQQPVSTKKAPSNVVITEHPDPKDSLQIIKDNDNIGKVNLTVPGGGDPGIIIPTPSDGFGGTGTSPEPPAPAVDVNTVRETAEIMPSYPGGIEALKRFLQRNLTNPRDMEAGEMISVRMKFVVGYDGKLKGFETVQDGGEEFNKEVIRVLKKMPNWVPGKSNGQNVSVYYTIPVKFVVGD